MQRILFWTRVDRMFFLESMQRYIRSRKIICEIVVLTDCWCPCCMPFAQYCEQIPKSGDISEFVKTLIDKYSITGIIVADEYDLRAILDIREWLDKRHILYYSPDKATLDVCLSKKVQYEFLRANGFDVPCSYFPNELGQSPENVISFPAVMKPISGHGSIGVREVSSKEELCSLCLQSSDVIVQTKSYGDEYTVDCFSGLDGKLMLSTPRKRVLTDAAHSLVAQLRFDMNIQDIANDLSKLISISGPWNFQLFYDDGKYLIHDINPRLSSGIGFCIAAGIPYEKMAVCSLLGVEPEFEFHHSQLERLDYSYIFSFREFSSTATFAEKCGVRQTCF